jgi:hypothetical protein
MYRYQLFEGTHCHYLQPQRWWHYVPLKHWYQPKSTHVFTNQKTKIGLRMAARRRNNNTCSVRTTKRLFILHFIKPSSNHLVFTRNYNFKKTLNATTSLSEHNRLQLDNNRCASRLMHLSVLDTKHCSRSSDRNGETVHRPSTPPRQPFKKQMYERIILTTRPRCGVRCCNLRHSQMYTWRLSMTLSTLSINLRLWKVIETPKQ